MRCLSIICALFALACSEPNDGVHVFTASSLRSAMERSAEQYHQESGVTVTVVPAGSQVLSRQIAAGAPADLFVSANEEHLEAVREHTGPSSPLICNELVLLVPEDSPIQRFEDLSTAERVVLGAPEVPVGRYAGEALDAGAARFGAAWRARVEEAIVSRELSATAATLRLTLGAADAAINYRTEAFANPGLRAVSLDPEREQTTAYLMARLDRASDEAARFETWLRSETALEVLMDAGFVPCERADEPAP